MERIPEDFLLGAATSAYQIEGAVASDGRGPSIWDTFCRQPGRIFGGHTGDRACGHYHLFRDDVRLMKELGLQAYRFSIAWPRLFPTGKGRPNRKGLDFYSRLVDALLAAGIQPWATLYHWDLPQALQDRGGWQVRETAAAFADYAGWTAARLGDRVHAWMTLNEPWCSAVLGHGTGEHAPGLRLDGKGLNEVIHHLLLGHGLAVQALRAAGAARVGIVLNPMVPMPLTDDEGDLLAAEAAWRDLNDWWFEPLYAGRYPERGLRGRPQDAPDIQPGDLQTIASPTDFLGLNVYFPTFVRADPLGRYPYSYRDTTSWSDLPRTAMGWPVYPAVLYQALMEVWRRYRPPALYVTESGCATDDAPAPDGQVHDRFRREYLRQHLGEALRAREHRAPVKGYFVWSLLDNFEWAHGYSKRFGLCYVDYASLSRTPKASARWYARTLRTRVLEP
jgi:beta-glucosidase